MIIVRIFKSGCVIISKNFFELKVWLIIISVGLSLIHDDAIGGIGFFGNNHWDVMIVKPCDGTS